MSAHLNIVMKTEESSVLTTMTKKLVLFLELVEPIKEKVETIIRGAIII